jgi:hypothetical protein
MKARTAAACRFFTAEDAVAMALKAYYACGRLFEPPPGEPWMDPDGVPWSGPTGFAEAFSGELQARIGLLALDRLGEFYVFDNLWDAFALARLVDPEKMAPIIAHREAGFSATENAQFAASDNRPDNGATAGADNGR